jgi:hypothetical protein
MIRIIGFLFTILLLSSCNQEEKELVIMDGEKSFFCDQETNPSYVSVTGIWQIKNDTIIDPHEVKIICSKAAGNCQLIEAMIKIRDHGYYLSLDDRELAIKTWDNDKIIASGNEGQCFIGVLNIDLHTREVVLISILKKNASSSLLCSSLKDLPMPIVYKLVDESEFPWDYSMNLTKTKKSARK